MSRRLEHKTALVTGATSNIGRAIATAFAAEGARLVVSGRNQQRGAEVLAEIRAAGGRADFIAADLDGSANASRDLAQEAAHALAGHIDVLVNNAGIFPGGPTATTDEGTFDQVYAVNVKAPFFLTAAVAPAMVDHGGGAIINQTGAAFETWPGFIEDIVFVYPDPHEFDDAQVYLISLGERADKPLSP